MKGGEPVERVYDILKGINIMEIINNTKFKLASIISGGFGTVINLVYGEVNLIWIVILAHVIALDWITGSRASKLDGTYSSQYGIEGIARTVVLFFVAFISTSIRCRISTSKRIFLHDYGWINVSHI